MRFFNPKQNFFDWIIDLQHKLQLPVVDCGCGYGHLVRELKERGLPVVGIDPRYELFNEPVPPDLIPNILSQEAQDTCIVRTKPCILLVCRPCHSGFPVLIHQAKCEKSPMYYIGLDHNIDADLQDLPISRVLDESVGYENENLWKVHYRS